MFYTKKLQQKNNLLEEYFISSSKKLLKLAKLVENHRFDAVVTCEDSCWCWEVDEILGDMNNS